MFITITIILATLGIGLIIFGKFKNHYDIKNYQSEVRYRDNADELVRIQTKGAKKANSKFFWTAIAILLVAFFTSLCTIIPSGYIGVKTTMGQISGETISTGFHIKAPFVQSIKKENVMKQDVLVAQDQIEGVSAEKVKVYIQNVTVTYRLIPNSIPTLLKEYGSTDGEVLFGGIIDSAIKSSTVEVNAEEVSDRNILQPIVKNKLQTTVNEKYGIDVIHIEAINVGNIDRDKAYNDALSARNTAELERQQQELVNQKNIEQAEAEAKQKTIKAETDAKNRLIEAESIAEANRLLEESLTSGVLENKAIEKWNGQLPYSTDGATPFISIP